MSLEGYQAGWSDGYAEGYGCKLKDATEPFNPASLARPDAVQVIAKHLLLKRAADFESDDEAIGLARGIVAALSPRENESKTGKPSAKK